MADLLTVMGAPVSGEAQLDRLFGSYLAEYERAWQVYPDAAPYLDELRDQGFELAVLSNGGDQQQNMKLERIGVREYFSCVLTAESLGAAKLYREVFDRAPAALGSTSSKLTYVGDDIERAGCASGTPARSTGGSTRRLGTQPWPGRSNEAPPVVVSRIT